MRTMLLSTLGAVLLLGTAASAVVIDWVPIGNPGNVCETQPPGQGSSGGCFGDVGYEYNVGTDEVTNAQYAEFLNAKAASDPFELYNPNMGDPSTPTDVLPDDFLLAAAVSHAAEAMATTPTAQSPAARTCPSTMCRSTIRCASRTG